MKAKPQMLEILLHPTDLLNISGWDGYNRRGADVNGDGEINTADIILLSKYLTDRDVSLGE